MLKNISDDLVIQILIDNQTDLDKRLTELEEDFRKSDCGFLDWSKVSRKDKWKEIEEQREEKKDQELRDDVHANQLDIDKLERQVEGDKK